MFDNSTKVFDSPFEEIEITRQLQRSTNEASYFINKTPCRLKDITDLVMDTGLGRDSLSIITQGNISSFADAKPEDRRLLFEEAAGVSKYKKRKKISLNKLNQTKENLDRLQDILDELERQLTPLSRQAKKAEKFLKLREELSKIEISVLAEESYQLEKRKVELDEKRKYAMSMADNAKRKEQLKTLVDEARFEYFDRKARFDKQKAELELHTKSMNDLKSKTQRAEYEFRQANDVYQQLLNQKQILENLAKQPFQHQAGVRAIMSARRSLSVNC